LPTKYLPATFHSKKSKDTLLALVSEQWENMRNEAQFVVLCVGLAFRDVAAANIREEGVNGPEDMPQWVRDSGWIMKDIHDVLDVWANQLEIGEVTDEELSDRGKGKGKGKGGSKRKDNDGDDDSDSGPK
jgi:hypothetical protein